MRTSSALLPEFVDTPVTPRVRSSCPGPMRDDRAIGAKLNAIPATRRRKIEINGSIDRQTIGIFLPGMAPRFEQALQFAWLHGARAPRMRIRQDVDQGCAGLRNQPDAPHRGYTYGQPLNTRHCRDS